MKPAVVCGANLAVELRAAGYEPVKVDECVEGFHGGAVIVLDALTDDEVAALQRLLADSGRESIAVLVRRWDGLEPLPLASQCRGIISGFGMAGVSAALDRLAMDR